MTQYRVCARCGERYSVSARCCAECPEAYREEWPKGRAVLRCGAEGSKQGHVTVEYPAGCPKIAESREAPAWCPQEPRDLRRVYVCQDCEERAAARLACRKPRLIYGRGGMAVVESE